ncbi:hypothetical protein AMTRI_Chr06g169970 [Amborella trichopoda]|nr:uncharacterized protein LOC18434509 isoform X1 [Amborella trichopoda]|eukprot:XP_006844642.2 uncharacterized protein LOC18434509 isoform X1 [Amborella trichopoda]
MHRLRSNRKRNQDLELRLGPSTLPKRSTMATRCSLSFPNPITIEDDDDDEIQISTSRAFAEARGVSLHGASWGTIITDEDLELRLGFGGHSGYSGNPPRAISICDDGEEDDLRCVKKKKGGLASTSVEVKLTCAICMDTMKEETSTVCGHLFCKPCITSAIQAQKKCPQCRRKLSNNNIHRIYLPGANS